ncbi:MAG: putative toxin-antitoxin system toxin component, PIN family [Candidatus Micrarchaeota archaeon]
MNLVVDANIIIAALIKDGITIELLLEPQVCLYCPEFLFDEIFRYQDTILEKTSRSEEEFSEILTALSERLVIVPMEEIRPYLGEATAISPDPDDVVYFALALKLGAGIWSNDKLLKKQNKIPIYSTADILVK